MTNFEGIRVSFVAGFGPIVRDFAASRKLYSDALGITFIEEQGGYLHTGNIDGVKHLALWPLAHAAQSCFGSNTWPQEIPIPQAWLEFDVEDVPAATAILKSRGYKLLVEAKEEPWGQIVTRLLSPEGLLLGITYTPSLRS